MHLRKSAGYTMHASLVEIAARQTGRSEHSAQLGVGLASPCWTKAVHLSPLQPAECNK